MKVQLSCHVLFASPQTVVDHQAGEGLGVEAEDNDDAAHPYPWDPVAGGGVALTGSGRIRPRASGGDSAGLQVLRAPSVAAAARRPEMGLSIRLQQSSTSAKAPILTGTISTTCVRPAFTGRPRRAAGEGGR